MLSNDAQVWLYVRCGAHAVMSYRAYVWDTNVWQGDGRNFKSVELDSST
jgi:hypothetical protein